MATRLEIIVEDRELVQIQAAAHASDQSVVYRSRAVLTAASTRAAPQRVDQPNSAGFGSIDRDPSAPEAMRRKLAALDRAVKHRFPAPDIDQMQREIEEDRWT